MLKLVIKKISLSLLTFIFISIAAFSMIHLVPGDPVKTMFGERSLSLEDYTEMKRNLGLDESILKQYSIFIFQIMKGDFGTSFLSRSPVLEEFKSRFPATLELSFLALLIAIFIGLPFGVLAAIYRNKFLDYFLMGGALVGYSMPIFWWALIMISFFSVSLGWFPVSGRISFIYEVDSFTGFILIDSLLNKNFKAFLDALHHLILPSIVLSTIPLASIARITRSCMIDVLTEDYMRTAYAKGLHPIAIFFKHALRNVFVSVITVIGLSIGTLLTGAILTETIFSWPGIGRWMVYSVESRDYPSVQGGLLLISIMVIIVNLSVDFIYTLVNPRVKM